MEHDKKYYQTLFKKKIDEEINDKIQKCHFVSAAKKSERPDVYLEKKLELEHLKVKDVKEQLKQKGIYLSNMQKRKKCTDCCKSLSF